MRKTCLKLYQACLVLGAMLHPFEPSPRMYYFCVPLRKTPKNTWYGVFCLTCTQCGRAGRSAKQGKAWKIMIKTILWQLNDIFCRHFCHKLLSTDSWYFLLPPLLGVAAGSLVVAQIHLYWDQSLWSSSWSLSPSWSWSNIFHHDHHHHHRHHHVPEWQREERGSCRQCRGNRRWEDLGWERIKIISLYQAYSGSVQLPWQ